MPVEMTVETHQTWSSDPVYIVKASLPDEYQVSHRVDSALFHSSRDHRTHILETMLNALRNTIDREVVEAFDRVMATVSTPATSRLSVARLPVATLPILRLPVAGAEINDVYWNELVADKWAPDRERPDHHVAYRWVEQMPNAARTIRGAGYSAMMLTTPRAVWNEAKHMQHCVWRSYRNKIERGKHIAFHLECRQNRYTLGLEDSAEVGRWRQVMLSGYENASADDLARACAFDAVEQFNNALLRDRPIAPTGMK